MSAPTKRKTQPNGPFPWRLHSDTRHTAALVGLVTGIGEAVALAFRLFTGRLSDRTGRHWAISITGYAITMVCVPLLAVAGNLAVACVFIIGERFGKAVRTPARDTMLAEASVDLGRARHSRHTKPSIKPAP